MALCASWIHGLESQSAEYAAGQTSRPVDPKLGPNKEARYAGCYRNSRVEGPTGNRANAERANHHGRTNGQTVIRITFDTLGRSHIKHDIGQGCRENKLGEENFTGLELHHRDALRTDKEKGNKSRNNRTGDLSKPVGENPQELE